MRLNTERSIRLGERIHEEFGAWDKALKAARLRDGVYVLPAKKDKVDRPSTRRTD